MTNQDMQAEALDRARQSASLTNYPAIYAGFIEKGIPEHDIKPRENVFTFNAWKALGRSVKKGEHGVRVTTFIEKRDPDTDQVTGKYPSTTVVFHISQTEPTEAYEARRAARNAEGGEPRRRPYCGWRMQNGRQVPDHRHPDHMPDPGELAADRWNEAHGDRWIEE